MVAVDDEKVLVRQERERFPWTSRRSKDPRFPRVTRRDAEIAPVADQRGDRFRKMMQVDDDVAHVLCAKVLDNAANQRLARKRDRRFGSNIESGRKSGAQPGRENKCRVRQLGFLEQHVVGRGRGSHNI